MREVKQELTIGEGEDALRFEVSMLPATRAFLLWYRVLEAVGPAVAKAASEGAEKAFGKFSAGTAMAGLLDLDLGGLLSGLASGTDLLFQRMKPEIAREITMELLSTTHVYLADEHGDKRLPLISTGGKGSGNGQIDLIFRGRMLDMMRLVGFAWTVNYGDFSDALRDFGKMAQRKIEESQAMKGKKSAQHSAESIT